MEYKDIMSSDYFTESATNARQIMFGSKRHDPDDLIVLDNAFVVSESYAKKLMKGE